MPTTEQQIADLIDATNALTEEVAGKIGDIDDRVDERLDALGLIHTFHVNSATGSDLATGDADHPLATLGAALNKCPAGCVSKIHLHGANVTYTLTAKHWLYNAQVELVSSDANNPCHLTTTAIADATYNNFVGRIDLTASTLLLRSVVADLPERIDSGKPWSSEHTLVAAANLKGGPAAVALYDTTVNVSDDAALISPHVAGCLQISAYNVTVASSDGSGALIGNADNGVAMISKYSLTLSGGAVLATDHLFADASAGSNLLTN